MANYEDTYLQVVLTEVLEVGGPLPEKLVQSLLGEIEVKG
jgi:hypothetical protein